MPPIPKNLLLLLLISFITFQLAESQVSPEISLNNPNSATHVPLDQVSLSSIKKIYKIRDDKIEIVQINANNLQINPNETMAIFTLAEPIKSFSSQINWNSEELSKVTLSIPEKYIAKVDDGAAIANLHLVFKWKNPEYKVETNSFNGQLAVLLEDVNAPSSSRKLSTPVKIEVLSSADLDPVNFEIAHTNIPSQRVTISEVSPGDSIQMTILTPFNNEGHSVKIDVEPAIFLNNLSSIQGWGLQKIPVTLVLRGVNQQDSIEVNLSASMGSFSPSTVFVSANKAGKSYLQSEGLGLASIYVSSPRQSFKEINTEVRYDFPLRFLLAAIIGLLIGSIISHKKRVENSKPKGLWPFTIADIAKGLVLTGLYMVLGVNLFSFDLPGTPVFNEAIVCLLAAIGAGSYGLKSLFSKKPSR